MTSPRTIDPATGLQSPFSNVPSDLGVTPALAEDLFPGEEADSSMESDSESPTVAIAVGEEVNFLAEPEPPQRPFGLTCNVGRTEQKFRLGAGAALLAVAAFAPVSRGWKIGLGILGASELITGSLRYCPVSQALGINTCHGSEI
jgi:hypothetical protein